MWNFEDGASGGFFRASFRYPVKYKPSGYRFLHLTALLPNRAPRYWEPFISITE